ncbi:MAG: sugar phosphate isomerase/epimerase family protein [Armatimonadota bacterium]
MADLITRLAASPCCHPEMTVAEAMAAYSRLGFRKFEAFTSWVASAFDVDAPPSLYSDLAHRFGMSYSSLHLPPVTAEDDGSLERAVRAARFASAVGAPVVLFKASSRELYIRAGKAFLEMIRGLELTPVLQNHAGSPITTLEDFGEVLEGISDPRMKTVLEVGHFHSAGVHWRDGHALLGDTVALVHIKDQIGSQSVPFGTGEIDLPGLFRHLREAGYKGDFVVEMEVEDRDNTLRYLSDAIEYLCERCVL